MSARYEVRLKNQAGAVVAIIPSTSPIFKSLYLTKIKNAPGLLRFEIDGDAMVPDPNGGDAVKLSSLFEDDGQIEVKRRNQVFDVDWYTEWEGLIITPERSASELGVKNFVCYGSTYLSLAFRVDIAYFANTSYTNKSGPGETVIKELVYENIGDGASSADRHYDTTMPGLAIETDQGRGSNWEGGMAWDSLGDTLQKIAERTGLAFNIVGTGAATFEFRVYEGQTGSDRSNVGLNPNTGLNSAGNAPVIFSEVFDNIVAPIISKARSGQATIVHALGRGDGINRLVSTAVNAAALADSPWNKWERAYQASQQQTLAALDDAAAAELERNTAGIAFGFGVRQTLNSAYGKHYFFGDVGTASFDGIVGHKEIVEVAITVNEEGEDLRFTFADHVRQVAGLDIRKHQAQGVRDLQERVDRLESVEIGWSHSTANVSTPPTDAQLDAAFGTPADVGAGFMATLNDNGAGTNEYMVWSDGSNWWYVAGTKAV